MVKYIFGFVIPYFVFYLMFSFYEVNFNISGWSDDSRFFCMFSSFTAFIVITINLYANEKDNK